MKRALVSGVSGQDGSYLAELLLEKDYEVHGIVRRVAGADGQALARIEPIRDRITLHHGDVQSLSRMYEIVRAVEPDEVYHLAAQSHVQVSFEDAHTTLDTNAAGTLHLLTAVHKLAPRARFYNAATSELFGKVRETPQTELTPFHPRSPYGVSKAAAFYLVQLWREAYGLFACSGILMNHESPRRGRDFVTRKIARGAARIAAGLDTRLVLGNLDARRDWGHAMDYCIGLDVPILTPKGWAFYDEVNVDHEVINFDPVGNRLSRDTVLKKHKIAHAGKWVELSGRGVFIRCTPDHTIYFQQKSKASKGGWSDWKTTTAAEFCAAINRRGTRANYDYRLPHFGDYTAPESDLHSDVEIRLVGYLLTEGCLHGSGHGRGVTASISQSRIANHAVHAAIANDLAAYGLAYHERNRNDGVTEWSFDADSTRRLLSLLDSADVHVMPRWCYGLSRRQAELLFTAMMNCDGCWGSMGYSSSRYLLAVDFQTVAHLAGRRTTGVSQRNDGQYIASVVAERKRYTYVTRATEVVDSDDTEAWCVTTKHGTIVTRERGCISISGNCKAMHLMLQQERPDDYVVATGENHSVREFCQIAFELVGLDYLEYVVTDPAFVRPAEVDALCGDATKARTVLGWKPTYTFKGLVEAMVQAEVIRATG